MMSESLTQKTLKGTIWSFIERFSAQSLNFIVLIIIARLLSPKEFGLIGMLAVFIAVTQSIIDSGFTQALIRKQDRSEIDKNTVFYFNIVVSVLLYIILYFVSPYVALFYNEPQLCDVMKVICLVVIIDSFGLVQRANFTIAFDFKTQTKASVICAIFSGSIGIFLAYHGFGVWALVFQQLTSSLSNVIVLWIFAKWLPKFMFSWESFKELFGFGSKLMLSGLLDTLYRNIYQLVIGKAFSAESLGFYSNAHKFADFPASNLTLVLQRVTYPALCTIQNEDERLAQVYRKFLRLSAFLIFPLLCVLAGVAVPFVNYILGEKWSYVSILMVPICFQMMWYPIHSINLNLLQVKGRSDLFLRLEILKKIVGVSILFLSIPFGLLVMCYTGILSSLICLIINTYYTGKLINVGILIQLRDVSGTLIASFLAFAVSYLMPNIVNGYVFQLILGLLAGLLTFIIFVFLCRFKELDYIKQLIEKK